MPEVRFSQIRHTICTRSSLTCKVLLRSLKVPTEGIVPEAPTEAGRARPEAEPQEGWGPKRSGLGNNP